MLRENLWKLQPLDKKLILRDDELHIWRTTISENESNLDSYSNLLSQDEQTHAKEFYFTKDRNATL